MMVTLVYWLTHYLFGDIIVGRGGGVFVVGEKKQYSFRAKKGIESSFCFCVKVKDDLLTRIQQRITTKHRMKIGGKGF